MKKKKLNLWAALAALFLVSGILIWLLYMPAQTVVSNAPTPTPSVMPALTPTIAGATDIPTSTPTEAQAMTTPVSVSTPSVKKESDILFTLNIENSTVSVAYGVDEETLKRTPGWLPSSALPGEDGMCVVYGHRNRRHLRVLEKVEIGDEITATMANGAMFTYTVTKTTIYESTEDMQLPVSDGKTLVLVTCYPFQYSGNAPGKFVVISKLQ